MSDRAADTNQVVLDDCWALADSLEENNGRDLSSENTDPPVMLTVLTSFRYRHIGRYDIGWSENMLAIW